MTASEAICPRVAIISDTVDDLNGVALGLKRLVAAAKREGYPLELVGPSTSNLADDGAVRIPAAMSASLAVYPGMTWSVPELPPLVTWLAEAADLVQVATPGPMGLAGLIAGRMLRLPVIAQYHTEIGEYAARLTGIPPIRGIIDPLVGWFYRQADLCLAPSGVVEKRLANLGIPSPRVRRIERGVDLQLFHPARRDRERLAPYRDGDGPVALYVGRLSREKSLDLLLLAWTGVLEALPDARLLVVGEGPMASAVRGRGVIVTGPLRDVELATVFASADVFAFPSETETFGNVVVEAAASGLPAVVSSAGAAHEHVLDGVTGEVFAAGDASALAGAMVRLLGDPAKRSCMARAAREHALGYDLGRALRSTVDMYRSVVQGRRSVRASSRLEAVR